MIRGFRLGLVSVVMSSEGNDNMSVDLVANSSHRGLDEPHELLYWTLGLSNVLAKYDLVKSSYQVFYTCYGL